MEHPEIQRTMLTGYPTAAHVKWEEEDHPIEDFSGNEIRTGDTYYLIDGEAVLADNLEEYAIERLGAKIVSAT